MIHYNMLKLAEDFDDHRVRKGRCGRRAAEDLYDIGTTWRSLDYASLTILVKIGSAQGESRQNGPADPPSSEICFSFPSFVYAGLDLAAATA
jgi:hypothetical protein